LGRRTGHGAERSERPCFLGVFRRANPVDGATDRRSLGAERALLLLAAAERQRAHTAQEEAETGPQRPRAHAAAQSETFGVGPICTRSPTYAPISVKSTPSAESRTYMKAGIVFTVWFE